MGTKMACVRLVSHFFLHLTSFFFFFFFCLSFFEPLEGTTGNGKNGPQLDGWMHGRLYKPS